MSETNKRPWHLWAVGIFGILWTGMGGMDFVLTQGGNAEYLGQFSDAERAFFTSIPRWAVFFWALSLLTGIFGSLMLLFKKSITVPLYWTSLVSFLIVSVQNYIIASPSMNDVVGGFAMVFSVVIFLVIIGLLYYAIKMRTQGVLS